jgi:hypothetical protein
VDALIRKVALDPEETENFIHIPVSGSEDFVQGSFRTITIDGIKGIMAVVGKLKRDSEGSMHIQCFLFDKSKDWTMMKAQAWIEMRKKSAADSAVREIGRARRLLESWSLSQRKG